jgi:histidinol phosphatase-like PHP family hydrolase
MAAASTPHLDVNAIVAGYLRDLAYAQTARPKMFGYKRAASAVFQLEQSLAELRDASGVLPRIAGIGPGSSRVIHEVLDSGGSPTVERAVDATGARADIERRRTLRQHALSRAEVRRINADPACSGPTLEDYRGDLQMHSDWSDGSATLAEIADACRAHGYSYAAVTDHSHGLTIAGGISMAEAVRQRHAVDDLNRATQGFRLLQGIEANIGLDGRLDLSDDEAAFFEVVLAAPHSRLRRPDDQTDRMLKAVRHPHVRILAHPRGRMAGSRAGVVARWDVVFAAAAERGVAVEIDGDPARQDLDHTLAASALRAGCLFALDSDAHSTRQFKYVETALAHARLAGIPAERIVNCWPLDRLLVWLANPAVEQGVERSSDEVHTSSRNLATLVTPIAPDN